MALTAFIPVNEKDIKMSELLKMGASAPICEVLATRAILEDQIANMKAIVDQLNDSIKTSTYSERIKEMVDAKIIPSEDSKPMIEVTTRYGDKITLAMSKGMDSGFVVSDAIKDKAILDSVVPDKYKKVSVTIDKKAMEVDFDEGKLPEILKGYCSKNPTEVLKVRKSVKKGE